MMSILSYVPLKVKTTLDMDMPVPVMSFCEQILTQQSSCLTDVWAKSREHETLYLDPSKFLFFYIFVCERQNQRGFSISINLWNSFDLCFPSFSFRRCKCTAGNHPLVNWRECQANPQSMLKGFFWEGSANPIRVGSCHLYFKGKTWAWAT